MEKEFVPYTLALEMKSIGFDEPCLAIHSNANPKTGLYTLKKYRLKLIKQASQKDKGVKAPLYQQAINFLYICSNKQIDIELKGSDTYEERIRKIEQGCKDLWNLQNNKSN